jgi:hypothetical protein
MRVCISDTTVILSCISNRKLVALLANFPVPSSPNIYNQLATLHFDAVSAREHVNVLRQQMLCLGPIFAQVLKICFLEPRSISSCISCATPSSNFCDILM